MAENENLVQSDKAWLNYKDLMALYGFGITMAKRKIIEIRAYVGGGVLPRGRVTREEVAKWAAHE